MRALRLAALAAAIGLAGCSGEPSARPPAAETVGSDGLRRIPIEAGERGYLPAQVTGKPGERLVLVFTRTVDGACLSKIVVGDAAPVDLPKGKPIAIPVDVPASGELRVACGMDMFRGSIVAQKG